MNISIPGAAYEECLDPLATNMPAEIGLPDPTRVNRGRGYSMVYEGLTIEQAQEVGEHLRDMGQLWLANSDPSSESRERQRYRVCVKTGEDLLERVRHAPRG